MAEAIRNNALGTITVEQFQEVESVVEELKGRAEQARTAQNPLLLSTYLDMVKLLTPKVHALRKRLDRTDLAGLNRSLKEQRKAAREAAQSSPTA